MISSNSYSVIPAAGPVSGVVEVPGSKSITNRALLLSSLAVGESELAGALASDDTHYMAASLNKLGVEVVHDIPNSLFHVTGSGGIYPKTCGELFVGNSGTSARFLIAALTLGQGIFSVTGVDRMSERPILEELNALNALGADCHSESEMGGLPVSIASAGLTGGSIQMRADRSSQFLSAVLMAAPYATKDVTIALEGELMSQPYIVMTLQNMKHFGVEVEQSNWREYHIRSGQKYLGRKFNIEPDASGASYFFAIAAVTGGEIEVPGLGTSSIQGDIAFVKVLEQMGCTVHQTVSATKVIGPEKLTGIDVDMNAISDTVMSLAAIAPFASSNTTIRNVGHIRHKETDRLSAIAAELTKLGVDVDELPDGITIHPASKLNPALIETYDDHRMAMSFAITGLKSPGVVINNPGCVAKTFPDFFERFNALCYTPG